MSNISLQETHSMMRTKYGNALAVRIVTNGNSGAFPYGFCFGAENCDNY